MAKPSTPSKIVFILSLRNERRGDGRVVVRSGGDVAVVAMAMCLAVAVVINIYLCNVSKWLWSMWPHDEPPGTPRPLWSGKCWPLGMSTVLLPPHLLCLR